MKPPIIFYLLLLIFNLVSLYFIIDLFSYDEITGYLTNGHRKTSGSRGLAYLLYISTLLNLYFLSYVMIRNSFKDKP
nr:hypothetical protein [uncultured Flavobacterium sp.]